MSEVNGEAATSDDSGNKVYVLPVPAGVMLHKFCKQAIITMKNRREIDRRLALEAIVGDDVKVVKKLNIDSMKVLKGLALIGYQYLNSIMEVDDVRDDTAANSSGSDQATPRGMEEVAVANA